MAFLGKMPKPRSKTAGPGFGDRAQQYVVQAAGRVLSSRNASTLKTSVRKIKDACGSIEDVLAQAEGSGSDDPGIEVIAAGLKEDFERRAWHQHLDVILESLLQYYLELHEMPLARLKHLVESDSPTEADRQRCINDAISEALSLLRLAVAAFPEQKNPALAVADVDLAYTQLAGESVVEAAGQFQARVNRRAWTQRFFTLVQMFREQLLMTLRGYEEGTSEQVLQDFEELIKKHSQAHGNWQASAVAAVAASAATPADQGRSSPTTAVEPVFATDQEAREMKVSWNADLQVADDVEISDLSEEVSTTVEAKGRIEGNLHPVRGILFQVDQVSDVAPQVGPGLPLYIPKTVAEKALNVANLPLEAAKDFRGHAKDQPCGVMTSAEIIGGDFSIAGMLWPFNVGDRLDALVLAQDRLGMSMNANVVGRPARVQGQQVFWVEELQLLGAAILLSEIATYKSTKVAAQAQEEPLDAVVSVAASGDDSAQHDDFEESELMELEKVLEQLNQLSGQIQASAQQFETATTELNQRLGVLESAREQEVQAAAAAQEQEKEQQSQQELIQAVGDQLTNAITSLKDSMPEMIRTEVAAQINPRGVRPRRTVPVVAGGGGDSTVRDPEYDRLVAQLRSKQDQLEGARQAGGSTEARMKLIEEIRALQTDFTSRYPDGQPLMPVG